MGARFSKARRGVEAASTFNELNANKDKDESKDKVSEVSDVASNNNDEKPQSLENNKDNVNDTSVTVETEVNKSEMTVENETNEVVKDDKIGEHETVEKEENVEMKDNSSIKDENKDINELEANVQTNAQTEPQNVQKELIDDCTVEQTEEKGNTSGEKKLLEEREPDLKATECNNLLNELEKISIKDNKPGVQEFVDPKPLSNLEAVLENVENKEKHLLENNNEVGKVTIEKTEDQLQQQENEVCDDISTNDSKDTSLMKDEIDTIDDIEKITQVKDEQVLENTECNDNPTQDSTDYMINESTAKKEKKEEESMMTNVAPADLKENKIDANISTNTTNDAAAINDEIAATKEVEMIKQDDNMDQTSKNSMVDIESISKDTNFEKNDEDPNEKSVIEPLVLTKENDTKESSLESCKEEKIETPSTKSNEELSSVKDEVDSSLNKIDEKESDSPDLGECLLDLGNEDSKVTDTTLSPSETGNMGIADSDGCNLEFQPEGMETITKKDLEFLDNIKKENGSKEPTENCSVENLLDF